MWGLIVIRITIVSLVFVLAACGQAADDETSGSTTPSPPTTIAGTTSTSVSSTTTDTQASTTTTLALTTTSPYLIGGDWADQPVIVSGVNGMVLGWWDGSDWIEAGDEAAVPVAGGDDYQTVVLHSLGMAAGAGPTQAPDVCSLPSRVELEGPELIVPESGDLGWSPYGFGISAPWNLTPNEVDYQPAESSSRSAIIAELLARRGIDIESPRIRQMVDVDLDGDGSVETVIVADGDDPPVVSHDGYYSLVVHLDSDGEVSVVADSPEQTDGFPVSYRIGGIADLNGDGTMEIVLTTLAIENSGAAVYEWVASEQKFALRLQGGCGG